MDSILGHRLATRPPIVIDTSTDNITLVDLMERVISTQTKSDERMIELEVKMEERQMERGTAMQGRKRITNANDRSRYAPFSTT